MRRLGDRVRCANNAHGERTGTSVAGRAATVVDRLPADDVEHHERYWLRFSHRRFAGAPAVTEETEFFDWVDAADIRDR